MRGVLVFVSAVAVLGLATACEDDSNTGPLPPSSAVTASPSATAGAAVGTTGAAAELGVPEFSGDLPVDLVIGLRMLGLGCRPTTPRDACSTDGLRTYTWLGQKQAVDLTTARMRPEPDHGAWVVTLRFDPGDRSSVTRAAARAGAMGGYALLLDPHTGDALGAVKPAQVLGGQVVVDNLSKPDAWNLVSTYVTAATQR
jgi:hypothetical protein